MNTKRAGDDEPTGGSGMRTRGLRILIVEGHASTAEMLRYLLTPEGHDCSIAVSPDAALAAIRELQPDVALIGVGAPGAPWLDLARRIRIAAGPDLRLIASTGIGTDADRARAIAADVDSLLEKPVSFADLVSRLAAGRPEP